MKYSINKTNYHSFEVFEDNRLRPRAYFVPYSSRKAVDQVSLKEKRYKSEKVVCLNGDWDFKFYANPNDLPDVLDTETVEFDRIDVPSCMQFRGYDRPFYLNVRYQFPYNPPVIPTTDPVGKTFSWTGVDQKLSLRWKKPENEYNFVGVYRQNIKIDNTNKHYVISFLGVASCLDIYLNGEYVGYSEGSHNTAEFDLTGKLKAGDNELLCLVHRWCNSSYLECQDMFRNTGIFRDVLLRISDKTDIFDINAKTRKTENGYELAMTARLFSDTMVTFTIEGPGLKQSKVVESENKRAKAVFKGLDVKEWNAEEPTLYTIYYETPSACIKERIGFKTVEIKGDVFFLNGNRIKLHGVNHHDTNAKNGYCMTPDEIEKDMLLCKEYNIDTVRTSHYPPDPLLLEYADELGLYLIDENDLETHGTFAMQLPPDFNSITHDPKWQRHYLDRIEHLYERDKIHANTSIIMWSLGNEAGAHHNTDLMYAFLKKNSDLPVQYESAVNSKRVAYDVGSEMYPPIEKFHKVATHSRKQKELNDRPYFLCEYAHAMGVGPGNIESYWNEIYNYDNLMGGCVWEMVDHAVLHEDGSYTYGGDHGEWCHDGNFCVDGIFYPDRSPSTGAFIVKHCYRPIRVSHVKKDVFNIFNTCNFTDGENYELTFNWNDGSRTSLRPSVKPLSREDITVNCGSEVDGNLSVIVETKDLRTGKIVANEQIVIKEKVSSAPEEYAGLPDCASFDGRGISLDLGDAKLESNDPYTIFYRAATDNDKDFAYADKMLPFIAQTQGVINYECLENGYRVVSKVKNKKAQYLVTDEYTGLEDGRILVRTRLKVLKGKGYIPRFGKTFKLPSDFTDVSYHGRIGETYADMRDQFVIGDVNCKVKNMTEPNIKPQESGNRMDVTFAEVSNEKHKVSFTAVDKSFELAIKPYTDRALADMKHRCDEVVTGTYVTIQGFQQGIGTASCGPGVADEFRFLTDREYEFAFIIGWE